MTPADFVTTPQAGQILGRSPITVRRFVRSGALKPAMRLDAGPNGAYLFHRTDVEQLAKSMARARTREGQPTLDMNVDDVDPDSVLDPAV